MQNTLKILNLLGMDKTSEDGEETEYAEYAMLNLYRTLARKGNPEGSVGPGGAGRPGQYKETVRGTNDLCCILVGHCYVLTHIVSVNLLFQVTE